MIENLTICHVKKNTNDKTPPLSSKDWVLFETCQRKIYISMLAFVQISEVKANNISKGEVAYLTLLKVLCGLESRIAGETEVFGQFKVFANKENSNHPNWFNQFRRIAQDLIVDVKEIRNKYLNGVGLRSYGSLTKSYVNECQNLSIFGGGQLAQKVLPYINDGTRNINMFLRSTAKAKEMPDRLIKNVNIHALCKKISLQANEGLIIAAPLTSLEIENWLKKTKSKPLIIVDLRDISSDRMLEVQSNLITLDDLFIKIEKNSKLFQTQIENAQRHILALTQKRFSVRHFRPFGWEDICA